MSNLFSAGLNRFKVALAVTGAALIGFNGQTIEQYFRTSVGAVVDSIAAVRAFDKTKFTRAVVTGYYGAGDGGGGNYYVDAADTTSIDNGGTILVAADGARWKLAQTYMVGCKQFGAKGDARYLSAGVLYSDAAFTIPATDDTAALNKWLAWLTAGAAGAQHCGYWQTGNYKITGAGLSVTVADTLPSMFTDGAESVVLRGSINTLITFTVSGGSGMLPTVEWAGIKCDGLSATATNEGVRVNGLCFFTFKGWHFYNLGIAGRLYNLGAGLFTEGVVFNDCYFHTTVTTALRYSVGAGTNSFRSSGLYNCKINIGASSLPIIIDNGCVPYMAPMEVTLWNYRANAVFVQNNSTQVPVLGNLTLESFPATNKLTLCLGSGFIFQLGRPVAWGTNSDKLFKGNWITCNEYFNAPDIGQVCLPESTAGSIVTTGVGQTFSLKYLAGVGKPFRQDSAILTICVTAPGYLWQGVYMVMSGATDNVVNATPIASNVLLNTAGYGPMTVAQGTGYNVAVSNPTTAAGTKCSYSYSYMHGLIPQE